MSKKASIWLVVFAFGVVLPSIAIYSWLTQGPRGGMIIDDMPRDLEYERLKAALPQLDGALNDAVVARYGAARDPALADRVGKMGKSLARESGSDAATFRFTVLADKKTLRTIALPGGSIYLSEKLARFLKSDDPLAAVLAHEIGHVRHSLFVSRMKSDPDMLAWLAASDSGKMDPTLTQRLLEPLLAQRYTDDDEHNADVVATRLLTAAGRDPKILLALPGLMEKAGPGEMALAHPASPRRAAALDDMTRQMEREHETQFAYAAVSAIRDKFGGDAQGKEVMKVRQLEGQLTVFTGTMEHLDGVSFSSTVLADPGINAFVLPNGDLFMTQGLIKLLKSDEEVSAFWSHLVGHVVARHRAREMTEIARGQDAERMEDDPRAGKLAMLAIEAKYTPEEELEAVAAGARTMMWRNLDPRKTLAVMDKVIKASSASGNPAFAAAHPLPAHSGERIQAEIDKMAAKAKADRIR